MSFKGDLSSVGLAEVFQMISMSKKEGTLVVQDTRSRKSIYFGQDGIQVLSTGRRKVLRVGELLVRRGKLNPSKLQSALMGKQEGRLLGEYLVEHCGVSTEDIDDVVRWQIEEEIYDLFLWRSAVFEFTEGAPSKELQESKEGVIRLVLDVNALLMEALRRVDEWKVIHEELQGEHGVPAFPGEAARWNLVQKSEESIHRILMSIDGTQTIGDIIEGTGLPSFDVCCTIRDLLRKGEIRLLSIEEIEQVAERKIEEGRHEQGYRLYEAALVLAPERRDLSERYARALEHGDSAALAAEEYLRLGQEAQIEGDADASLRYLRRASTLAPKNLMIGTALCESLLLVGDVAAATEMGEGIANQAYEEKHLEIARTLSERLLAANPQAHNLRVRLIRTLQRCGEQESMEEQLRVLQRNLPTDPRESAAILEKVSELMTHAPATQTTVVKPPPRPVTAARIRRRRKPVLMISLAVAGLALAFGVKFELDAASAYEEAEKNAEEAAARGDFVDALRDLRVLRQSSHRWSLITGGKIEALLGRMQARKSEFDARADERKREELDRAIAEMIQLDGQIAERFENGDLDVAQKLVDRLRTLATDHNQADVLDKANAHSDQINRYIAEASALFARAEELLTQGDHPGSARAVDELRRRFRKSPVAKNARYPLLVKVQPAGAQLQLNGVDLGGLEEGRKLLRLEGAVPARLVVSMPGYRPKEIKLDDPLRGEMELRLDEKIAIWTLPVSGFHRLVHAGANGVLLEGPGALVGVDPHSKRVLWRESIAEGPEFLSAVGGRVYFGTKTRELHGLNPGVSNGGREAIKLDLVGRILSPVVISPDGVMLYVVCDNKVLYAFSTAGAKIVWRRELRADLPHPVLVGGDVLYVACGDGTVYAFDALLGGEPLWEYTTKAGIRVPLAMEAGRVLVGTTDGRVHALSADSGSPGWVSSVLTEEITAPLTCGGGRTMVSTREGSIAALDVEDGAVRWSFLTRGPVRGGTTLEGGEVYACSDDGCLYRIDAATGRLVWRYEAGAALRGTPVLFGGTVFGLSEKPVLHAVARE